MGNMILGGYTFANNPDTISATFDPDRRVAVVDTYDSVAVLSFGVSMIGKQIDLGWTNCNTAQYEQFRDLYEGDSALQFDPQNDSGKVYQVEIIKVDGVYFHHLFGDLTHRKDVKLTLLFLDNGTVY